jgi:hypothetical protein
VQTILVRSDQNVDCLHWSRAVTGRPWNEGDYVRTGLVKALLTIARQNEALPPSQLDLAQLELEAVIAEQKEKIR